MAATMNAVEAGVGTPDSAGACIFPTLRDTQWEDIELNSSLMKDISRFCDSKAITPHVLAAGLWAVILRQFADVDEPQIWRSHFSEFQFDNRQGSNSEPVCLMSVCLNNETAFEDLLSHKAWSVVASDVENQSNSGVVIRSDGFASSQERTSRSICDILLVVQYCVDHPRIFLSYRDTVLSNILAGQLVGTIEHLAQSAIKNPAQPLGKISLMSDQGLRQIQKWLPGSFQETTHPMHVQIHTNSLEQPNAQAVESWDGSLTYSELNQASSQVATHIRGLGVGRGVLVPVYFEKSKWAIVAMLAVNKVGGAFVPVGPSLPVDRLKDIIKRTGASLILASSQSPLFLRHTVNTVTIVSETSIKELPYIYEQPENTSQGDDPAYCLFTSGSTGEPKGCLVGQSAFASIAHHNSKLRITSHSRVLQYASFGFGMALIEIFCTLSSGGTVCIPSDEDRMNSLANTVASMNIGYAILTPTVLSSLHPREVPCLKTILLAGEPIQQSQIALWTENTNIFQAYGFTEWSGIWSVSHRITSKTMQKNIGFPVNGRVWLVDPADHSRLRPIGAVAELVVQGPSLALGYLSDSKKTAQVFISEPPWMQDVNQPSNLKDKILYKTGDLVRYNSDGSISYIGRKDTQVKIRGQRVELGEIEALLRQLFPEAKAAVAEVAVLTESNNITSLVAFILTANSAATINGHNKTFANSVLSEPSVSFLRDAKSTEQTLRQKLPSYMVPSMFLPVRQMPRTITGKTDRRRLRNEAASLSLEDIKRYRSEAEQHKTVSTSTESILAGIWAQVFNLSPEQIGAKDDFYTLGGDSVVAMRVVTKARSAGIALTIADVFGCANLASLAERASKSQGTLMKQAPFSLVDNETRLSCISHLRRHGIIQTTSDVTDVMPAMPNQDFIMDRFALDHFSFLLNGYIDFDRLKEACRAVIRNHSILRTVFTQQPSGLFQVVLRDIEEPLHRVIAKDDLEEACCNLINATHNRSLHLDRIGVQFTLVSCSETRHALDFRLSHAQHDAFSVPMLFNSVADVYDGLPLSPASQFSNYVHYRTKQDFSAGYDFWREYLKGSSMTRVGIPQVLNGSVDSSEAVVSPVETLPLPNPPAGITLATMVKAAWAYLLGQLTHETDLVFGQTVNGRNMNLANIDAIMGPCINFIPFRVHVQKGWTVSQFLHHVQEQYIQTADHDHLDMAQIVKGSTSWPTGTNFGCIFQHQNVNWEFKIPFKELENTSCLGSLKMRPQSEVWILSFPREHELLLNIRGASRVIGLEKASSLVKSLRTVVQAFERNPNIVLSSLEDHGCSGD